MPAPSPEAKHAYAARLNAECAAEQRPLTVHERVIGRRLSDDELAALEAVGRRCEAERRTQADAQRAEMRALAIENAHDLRNASPDEVELHRIQTERACAVVMKPHEVAAIDREIGHVRRRIARQSSAA